MMNMLVKSTIAAVLLLVYGLTGPTLATQTKVQCRDVALAPANNSFGIHLVKELLNEAGEENLFISPYSIFSALAVTSNGASGATLDAMRMVLEFDGMDEAAVNTGFELVNESLRQASGAVQLSVANSLWARKDVVFSQGFLQRAQEYYDAHIERLDFLDSSSLKTINDWVRKSTNGHIEEIINRIDPLAVLFIINAVYFHGDWTNPFDPNLTSQLPFHSSSGRVQQHPMMKRSGRYRYLEGEQFRAVRIPYGEEERMSLYAFLPEETLALSAFVGPLSDELLRSWITQMEPMQGSVTFPRFTAGYEANLKDALASLGMGVAFDSNEANFKRMIHMQAWINSVKHKAVIEVNEQGSEAAAATSVEIRITSIAHEGFSIVFDRPFFYVIRDDQTGIILFCGTFVRAG